MICFFCKFNHGNNMWNRCDLTGSEYYWECTYDNPCKVIGDDYRFLKDFPELGFLKGEKAEIRKES